MEFLQTLRELDSIVVVKLMIATFILSMGLYYAKYFKSFILWVKGGIENGDGVLQNKDLQIASFTAFCGFILLTIAFWNTEWPESVVYSVFGTTAALFGIKNLGQAYVDSKKTTKSNKKKTDIDEKTSEKTSDNDSDELG